MKGEKKMKTIDFEMVMICGVMALAAALGFFAVIIVFTGTNLFECNPALLSGSYIAVSGLLWGNLLFFNGEKNKKSSKCSGK